MNHGMSSVVATLALALSVGCSNGDSNSPDFSNAIQPPTALTQGTGYTTPLDAAPDGNNTTVYFVASGGTRGAGVFKVSSSGGASAEVFTGAPFVAPRGIAVSSDSSQLAVADPMAQGGGAVYTLPVAGGAPTVLTGTAGTAPQGLEIARINNVDLVFYTGTTADTHQPALFQVALSGGTPVILAQGAPLVSPSAVVISSTGTVFVSDRGANGTGSVYQLSGSRLSPVINNVRMGDPAGLALSVDNKILAVSSLSSAGTSQVLMVELATGAVGAFNQVLRANTASGGLHRAHGGSSNAMAWCGVTAGSGGGVVYRVEFR